MTTLGYGDITPNSSGAKFLTSAQVIIGVLLLGLTLHELNKWTNEDVRQNEKYRKIELDNNKLHAFGAVLSPNLRKQKILYQSLITNQTENSGEEPSPMQLINMFDVDEFANSSPKSHFLRYTENRVMLESELRALLFTGVLESFSDLNKNILKYIKTSVKISENEYFYKYEYGNEIVISEFKRNLLADNVKERMLFKSFREDIDILNEAIELIVKNFTYLVPRIVN